jgi:hypothetical protein
MKCPHVEILTVSQETGCATLVAQCALSERHAGNHRWGAVDYINFPLTKDELAARALARQIIENQQELDENFDKKTDQFDRVIMTAQAAAPGGCCKCHGECWRHPECPCMSKYGKDSNTPLLKADPPKREKPRKLPGWWAYARSIPKDYSPVPPGLRPSAPADPLWERKADARMLARKQEIKQNEEFKREHAAELDAALIKLLDDYERTGYVVTFTGAQQWRVSKDGRTIGTYRGVPRGVPPTPEAKRPADWYTPRKRLNACTGCGRTTFGEGSRVHSDGCSKG